MSETADLSNWGVAEDKDPTPEDSVKIGLSEWLESHGATVYWEKTPSYGYDTFRTTGTDRPDLVAVGDGLTFALEVKDADDTGTVHSGFTQTRRYWRNYTREDTEEMYQINGEVVDIDAFLLATQFSPEGSVYARWFDRCVREWPVEKRMSYLDPPIHFMPKWEYSATEAMTRGVWRNAKEEYGEGYEDSEAGIGTLLSEELDWSEIKRLEKGSVDPFERADAAGTEPRALYKRPVCGGGGIESHNWGWVQ